MNKIQWERIKGLGPTVFALIKPPSGHPGALHGPKVRTHGAPKTGKPGVAMFRGLTNHDRVIMGRAKQMKISVAEYKRRFA